MPTIRKDNKGPFLARELEKVLNQVLEVEYADIKYSRLIPISTEIGPAADSFTVRIFDKQGSMKFIGDRAQDLPRSDILRKELTYPVRSIGGSFAYSFQELRASAMVPGMNIDSRRAEATRRAYEEKCQEVAYFGDPGSGMQGLFNNNQMDKLVPDKWFTDSGTTADEMLDLLNEPYTRIAQNSNMKEYADTYAVPYNVFRIISTKARSTNSDTTILEFFLRTNPSITAIEPVNELEAAKSGGYLSKDRIIAYRRDPMKLQFQIAQPLEFFPPLRVGLEFQVAAHARLGGLALWYPKSCIALEKA